MIQFADTIAMFPTPIATVKHDPENDWEIESMALKNSPLRPQQPGPEQHSQSEDSYIKELSGSTGLRLRTELAGTGPKTRYNTELD